MKLIKIIKRWGNAYLFIFENGVRMSINKGGIDEMYINDAAKADVELVIE